MSETWIAIGLLPLLFVLVVVVECSRLHCARLVQRRMGTHPSSDPDDRL